MLATPPLWAKVNDARLRIVIPVKDMPDARMAGTKQALRLAWPRLLDRIVPHPMRSRADAIAPGYALIARIIPGRKQTVVEFNGNTVFRALKKHHISAIITAPRFHLVLHIRNSNGLEMRQTEILLMNTAKDFAPVWGIELADNAPGIVAVWQWLDNQHVMLSVRGNSRLQEFSETRVITDADPLPKLSDWLEEILIKARDAYALDANHVETPHVAGAEVEQQLILTIDRKTQLMAQVALEDALGNDPRVRRVLPVSLSVTHQRYLLLLKGTDSSWLREWFKRRGYRLVALPKGGWLAQ